MLKKVVSLGGMFGIGWSELAIIFIIVLVLFGPAKAQEILRAIGKGVKEFKDALTAVPQNKESATTNADHSDRDHED